jgi:molecular chaperone DnaK
MSSWGIDLGTTNSVIARLVEGRPVAVSVGGGAVVPSVVSYESDRVVVGREARNLALLQPGRTVRSVKRQMGRTTSLTLEGREVTPEEVSAEILRTLARGAAEATGEEVREVVVTVPAWFDDAQRRATLEAGEKAGLKVLRLLNEPTAASLVFEQALGLADAGEPEVVLVYDLGGGTFDVSVLEVFGGVREVRATAGNVHLGGDDFDERLVRRFLDLLAVDGVDPREDARAMARLQRVAEETKIRLSTELVVEVREEFLTTHAGRPVHLSTTVTRADFEAIVRPQLESTMALAREAVEQARLVDQKLSKVLLVGGSTRIPLVRALLEEAFGVEVHAELDADLSVALGAAVQAGLLAGAKVDRILVDVSSHTLGIATLDDVSEVINDKLYAPVLPRLSVLPARQSRRFFTLRDAQDRVDVRVYQGEQRDVTDNRYLGMLRFDLVPVPEGSPVDVTFSYDLDGVVHVSAVQPGKGEPRSVALKLDAEAAPPPVGDDEVRVSKATLERRLRELAGQVAGDRKAAARVEKLIEELLKVEGEVSETLEERILEAIDDLEPIPF